MMFDDDIPDQDDIAPMRGRGDQSIGRIVSVTGSKAIVLLDQDNDVRSRDAARPEMGTLLAITQPDTTVLAIVSALSVPVPAQLEGDNEVWIAELGLVGELWHSGPGDTVTFNRGVGVYPSLGDRVRVASQHELAAAFCGRNEGAVRVGGIRQDASIPAMVRVDDLLGKHFAILGTTGTGKSCTTALILQAILSDNPNAHIVLLDPHNEYATAFKGIGEVISPRNMQLPYWLLNFEEIVEVLIGDPTGRKTEIETLQELIPIAKARFATGRSKDASASLRRGEGNSPFTVDTPVPYRMSDVIALIDERMGRLENKRDIHPYRQLKQRIEAISCDVRYRFMFGNVTVHDGMAQILGRIFRVPVNDKPITILELTGLPPEIVNVVVSVLCRMTFDFALWGEGQVPVTLVCEEAHRYVPAKANSGFEPCRRAIAKIAKEGRKYGASLCIVTQRPTEIDPTILSQCNTVFALRMSNDRDQQIVQSAVSDTGSGLLEFLPALGQREAIAFGDGVPLPVRIKFDELPRERLPRSSTARFSEKWQTSVDDTDFLQRIVDRWRQSGLHVDDDVDPALAMFAETLNVAGADPEPAAAPQPTSRERHGHSDRADAPGRHRRRNAEPQAAAAGVRQGADMHHGEVRGVSARRQRQETEPSDVHPADAYGDAARRHGNDGGAGLRQNGRSGQARALPSRPASPPQAEATHASERYAEPQREPADAPHIPRVPRSETAGAEIPRAPRSDQGGLPRVRRNANGAAGHSGASSRQAAPREAMPAAAAAPDASGGEKPGRLPESQALAALRDRLRSR